MSLWLNEHPKKRKTIVMIVLVAFVLQIALTPQLAFAQLVVADPPSMIQRALQWLKEGYTFIIEKALKVAAWKAFQTALQRFLGRIAYETAVWIGSGDKGKKPLLYTKGWKQYLEDAGDAAAGDFIETLADEWSGQADRKKEAIELQKDLEYQNALFANRECSRYGPGSSEYELPRSAVPGSTLPGNPDAVPDTFSTSCLSIAKERVRVQKELNDINTTIARTAPFLAAICTPPDGIQLKIALGLGTPTSPTAPKCTFSKMRDNWEKAVDDPAFLEKFSVSFHPSQSDLGVALDLQSNLLIEQDKRKINEQLTRSADGAFKSVTSTVTGAIQTPARLIDKKMEQVIEDANAAQKEQPPPGLLEGVATIFTTTLVSSLKDRMMKGFWNLREVAEKKKSPNLGGLGGRGGQSEVEAVFTSLKQVKLQENTNFDIVSQFQQCPTELKQQMNVYACVLDANFADAIRRGRGEPMTVREAMEEGLLQGAWNFGYDDPAQGREPAFNSGYAYSSMVKLRRFRIIPVGWEFAAEYIRGRNQPYTLEHVVNCFESADDPINSTWPIECQEQAKVDINKDGVINAQDQWNPFWHLVDPNWVLKAPQTNCRAWGPGQQVYKETGQRLDYCSDAQDCVVESDNGTCAAWGYCTREKNVWRFAGDTCDAQYDTCLNVRKEGTDEALSALQSSWDRAGCTQDTSGCAAHALQTFDASKQNRDGSKGAWVNTAKQRYLTSQAPSCAERAVGCRAFIEPRAGVNLVPNGNFERGDEGILPPGWDAPGTTLTKSLPIAQRGQAAILAKDFAGLHVAGAQQATATTGILGILPDHTYTVSAWGYIKTPPAPFRNIGMRLTRQQGGADVAFASALLDTTKTNQWQELRFGAVPGSDAINAPKLFLVADAGAEVFWDDISIADGAGSGMRPYGEGGLTYLRWTDETKPTLSCTKDEVGCTLYTPENGDPAKAGIVRQSDLCPNQCVGYATFTEQAPQNKFDVSRDVSLIPSTAKSCQTEDVGCDEFTNLDEVAKGGEGLTYFTEIRQCQKPAPVSTDCAPFYTYEGSASSGAQLQSYVLKASGTLDPATTDGSTTCNRSDANCRDFINAQGKHSFRDMRTTVTCSNDCIPFRKTRSTATQCQATGGEWNGNACTYDVIKSEGKQCRREVNGCRSYVGNTGHVLKTVARTDFERGKPAEWQSQKAVSPEAVRPGGHSLPLEPQEIATWTLPNDTMKTGARYTIYFLAKQETAFPNNAITFTVHVKNSGATTQTFTQNISAAGWHDYTVGPIVASQQSGWTLELQSSAALFIDDVLIRRTNDQYTLIQDSWNTPTTCTPATIGCQAYRTGSNDRLSFSRLTNSCAFEKVGCSAFIDTQNSTSPFSETWNAGDKAEAKTGADVITYLINRPDYACRQEERGCTALETFAPGKNGKLESKTTFLRDDPDLYPSILCASKSEGCSTYVGDGGPHYFKDPKNQFCEYRGIPGSKSFDWFKKGVINLQPDCPRVGWAKQCPSNQSRCTKFVDPLDVTTLHPNGYDYFALKNDSLDTSSCGTNVNRKAGCVLLQDTSSTSTTYSAAHTIEGSGSPMSTCVNANASRVTALNIVTRPNEQTLEFGGMKNVSVVAPIDAIAIEMKPKFVDYGSYMVEFEAKPRRLIGQVGSATVRVALETVAPGATSAPSLTPAPPAPSVNLLSNGGFEEGDEGKLPTDWRETVADSFIKSRPSAPRAQSSTPANDFIGREEATTQQVKARTRFTNVLSQQMYTMSAWAYIQTAPTGNGGVEARFVQEQGGRAIIVAQGQVDTSKVNEWQEVRFTARTSAGTIDEVRAELIVDPGGVVFWDDVSITLPVQTPIGGTTSTVPPAARRGGGTIPVGTALVSPGGWNRYVVGPVKVNRAADMTGRVVLDIPSDVVAIERVAVTLACDANVIMKVTRDRTCGEWLYCKSSVYQVDSAGEYREVCTELGRCKEANPDNPQECKTPVPTTFGEKVFSRAFYQYDPAAGHVGWAGLDYTGYSIPNIYPVETLRQITRSPTKLTFVEKGANTCKIDRDCGDPKNGNLCLNNICYKNKGIDGSEQETARKEKECRLYPDAASPLPSTLGNWTDTDIRPSPPPASAAKIYADWAKGGGPAGKTDYYTFLISKKAGFTYAEVCQKDSNNDGKIDDADLAGCDCSYKKVLYANGENRYYAEKSAPPPTLMEYEVDPPGSSDPLDASLTKYKKKSEDTYLGWRGYCLEGDANPRVAMYQGAANKPCFTWWPVDTLQGEIGLFTNYPKAGFEVEKPYYCLAAAWQEYRSSYNIKTCSGLKRCSGPDSCGGNYTKTYTDSGWAGLTRYKRYRCDPIGGERWYPYDGTFDGNELYTGLKQVCTDIAQIGDTTDNKAWTSRVFDVPSGAFTIQPPPSTTPVIQYADPQKPYGAIPLFVGDPRTATEYVEIPAAPSAFKIYSPCDYSGVWQTCISNSFKNGYLSGPGADGAKVLERLFAKSYGVFAASIEGKTGGGICTGVCLGGQNPGSTCTRSEQCIVAASIPPITPAINYDCRPDICMGGKNAGLSCAKITTKVTGICDGGTCGPDGYCVGGTEDKQVCSKKGECAVDTRLYPQGICDQGTKRCVGGDLHDFPCEPTDPESCSVNQDAECTQSSATPGGATAACAHQGSVAGELSGRACVAGDPQFDCNPLGTCGIGDIVQPNGTRQKITAPYCSNKPISQPGQPNQCATLGGITDCAATGTTLIYSELPLANPKNWWDITKTEPAATPPVIAAVITRNGQPTEGPRNQVTINGESTGDLVGENGTLHASLRFYAYNENGNQMPLKKITVNWGGNIVAAPIEGRIQNHKNICRREKALVCAVDARCTSGDRTKPCAHADIVVDQMKLTSTACLRDTTTNVIQEGTPCTAYRSAGIPAGTGLCYRIDAKPAVNFGDSEDACVDDKDLYTPGYFVFNYDYTTPGTYTVSVTVEDNWGQKQTATYPGVITVPPVSKP